MKQKQNSTRFLNKQEVSEDQNWILVDATGKTLGRFASEITKILRGKHKPSFTPNADTGDGVIIVNADKIAVTGSKESRKIYRSYTGAIGGLKEIPYNVMMKNDPEEILRRAVSKMMPRTKLAKAQLKRLRIFVGTEHGMQAQKPIQAQI